MIPFAEVSVLVEVVEHGGVNGNEFLQTSHPPEALHCTLSSPERPVRILNAVVEPTPAGLQIDATQITQSCLVGSKTVGHKNIRLAVPSHQFSEHFQCRTLVSSLGDNAFQHLALLINRTPEIVPLAIDLHEYLIDMPLPS